MINFLLFQTSQKRNSDTVKWEFLNCHGKKLDKYKVINFLREEQWMNFGSINYKKKVCLVSKFLKKVVNKHEVRFS